MIVSTLDNRYKGVLELDVWGGNSLVILVSFILWYFDHPFQVDFM